jgi:predicted dehydrogenase
LVRGLAGRGFPELVELAVEKMKLRIGLVGLGEGWQQHRAPALRALGDRYEVRAVYEQIGHRAHQAAEQFEATVCDSFQELAFREDVDAVLFLDRQWCGPLPIMAACDAGKAVYCYSGLDLELDQADLIKRRVEDAGIAFMAEFPRRQAAATIRLKELIATRLGAPQLVFCHLRRAAESRDAALPWRNGNGATMQEFVELVDWCRYVVGKEPRWTTGLLHCRDGSPSEDYRMLSLDFSEGSQPGTGPVAQISCGRYIPAGWEEAISYRPLAALQVSCPHGIAFVDLPSTLVWFDAAGRHQEALESERPVGEQLLAQFHRAVTSLVRQTADLEDAYRALLIVQSARQSHLEGRRVPIP